MLEIADVVLCPQDKPAQGFAHRFNAGEITVVLGANQSGKTDLCRLIAGLNTHATGHVVLDREDVTHVDPRRRSVSMVYQAFINYPNLTVAQNIASPLNARGVDATAVKQQVRDIAQRLSIDAYLQRMPHELSGGQQQRVAIARALAKQARVLLLDEPLVNLDFKLREALEVELRDLLHATNTVVIYTSSDPRDAFSLSDEVLLLHNGGKLQCGPPIEVYRKPVNAVAMELLADPCINRFQRNGVSGALRPEHLQVGDGQQQPESEHLAFDLRVTAYETNGDESFIHGEVEGAEWVVRCDGMFIVAPGTRVGVTALQQDVVWL